VAGRFLEGSAVCTTQLQSLDQLADGVGPRDGAHTSFQIADGSSAQSCPLGQLFLREAGSRAVALEQLAKGR
jgi:hypothetical protein